MHHCHLQTQGNEGSLISCCRAAFTRDNKEKGDTTTTRKQRAVASKDRTNIAPSNKRMRTTSQQKAFLLSSDKKKLDPLLLKQVAFDIYNNGDGTLLLNHFGGREAMYYHLFQREDTFLGQLPN